MAAYTTIDDPEAYFQVELYTGDGSGQSPTFDGDTDMQPDLVWIKSRNSASYNHMVFDSVRGATKYIKTDNSIAEGTNANMLTAFGSDGFTVGSDVDVNNNTTTYVAWCWKESATAGFDIVSYTGNATNRTISHSLSAVPKMMVTKNREETDSWRVYHEGMGNTKVMYLNITEASETLTTAWNSTTPTSSVFTVGTDNGTNRDGDGMIAYLFSEVQGFSKFGSYTGNGNASGTFVFCGFRPAYVLAKRTNSASGWVLFDNKREPFNLADTSIRADDGGAENESNGALDLLSNGFKWITTDSGVNGSGDSYVFMAFAEAPFVNSNGVPCNAR